MKQKKKMAANFTKIIDYINFLLYLLTQLINFYQISTKILDKAFWCRWNWY